MDAKGGAMLFIFGEFSLDARTGELFRYGERIPIQGKSFELLHALLQNPGSFVTREDLYKCLWPNVVVDYRRGLDTAVKKLRRTLQNPGEPYIETRTGYGYRLNPSVSVTAVPDTPSGKELRRTAETAA